MEIKVNHVDYTYNDKTKALNNLNMIIKDNSITGIIGAKASGKTTLAQILALEKFPVNGNMQMKTITVAKKNDKEMIQNLMKEIGFISEYYNENFLYDTVYNEIDFMLNTYEYITLNHEKRIKDSLKIVGLSENLLHRHVNTLSQGEKKKLMLAKMLSYNPKVIIIDEPSLDLDSHSQNELIKLLRMMKMRYHKTIILLSKDTNFINKLADYIYVIEEGTVKEEGSKYEVFSGDELEKTALDLPLITSFIKLARQEKNVKIEYRDDIYDLMKDVYQSAR